MIGSTHEESYGIASNPLSQQLGSSNPIGDDLEMMNDELNMSGQFSPPHEAPDDMMTGGSG